MSNIPQDIGSCIDQNCTSTGVLIGRFHLCAHCNGRIHAWCGTPVAIHHSETKRICSRCASISNPTNPTTPQLPSQGEVEEEQHLESEGESQGEEEEGVTPVTPQHSSNHHLNDKRRSLQLLLAPQGNLQKKPKSRVRLTLAQKLQVILLIREKTPYASIMKTFGISVRACNRIKTEAPQLEKKAKSLKNNSNQKSDKPCLFPEVEGHLLVFIDIARVARLAITRDTIRVRALEFRDKILQSCQDEQKAQMLRSFRASDHWITMFARRNKLRSVISREELPGNQDQKAKHAIVNLRLALHQYDADNIYNVAETGLLYRLLPKRTYNRGTKGMRNEDRMTLVICTNASASHRLPVTVIASTKQTHAFSEINFPLPYFQQAMAWNDRATCLQWFQEVFLSEIDKRTSAKVALILDKGSSHGANLIDPSGQVQVFYLPPTCAAKHQPMKLGVVALLRKSYKHQLLALVMEFLNDRKELQNSARRWQTGTMGLYEGHDPHVLDAAELISEIWKTLSVVAIRKCWLKANILPVPARDKLSQSVRRPDGGRANHDIQEILKSTTRGVEDLHLQSRGRMYDENGLMRDIEELSKLERKDMAVWLDFEDSKAFIDLHQSEALEEAETFLLRSRETRVEEENIVPSSIQMPSTHVEPLSRATVANNIASLEQFASSQSWNDAVGMLRRSKQLLLRGIRSKEFGGRQQLLIPRNLTEGQ